MGRRIFRDIVHIDWAKLKNVIHKVASKIVVAVVNKVPEFLKDLIMKNIQMGD